MNSLLSIAFVYLFSAVVAVPISKRLGLGSVLGYLIAGIIIGPVLGLVGSETHEIQEVAEFGVVMMLFLVGMELEPATLWRLRNKLLGLGGLQVLGTVAVMAGLGMAFGMPWQVAVAAGCVVASSSTAIVLQTLGEKGLLGCPGGQSAFSVLLFQDIAVIPMLALLPLLAMPELAGHAGGGEAETSATLLDGLSGWLKTLIILGVVGGIVVGGHYLSRPVFRYIAESRLREVYTAFALMLVVGIAALMNLVGLSPALGAFLAGVVLADSEYRHALESTLDPFKGLLLGLFFITVGAGMNFGLLASEFFTILGMTVGVMVVKAAVLYALGKAFRLKRLDNQLFSLSLSQAGEFGFVLISFVVQHAVMPSAMGERLMLVVALSMLLTPTLFIVYEKLLAPRAATSDTREADSIEEENPVIIAGHGRFGQMVSSLLLACGHRSTVIDYDAETVDGMTRYGMKTYYGDATIPALLETAGIARARLLILAIDGREQAVQIVEYVHRLYPDLPIISRAYDRLHVYELHRAGSIALIRELFDSSIRCGQTALEFLGMDAGQAERMASFYAARDRRSVRLMAEAWQPGQGRFSNPEMAKIGQDDDAETQAMMAALMRGESVDWQPGEEGWRERLAARRTAQRRSTDKAGSAERTQPPDTRP